MIRAPSSCGNLHRSVTFPRGATLRSHCLPSLGPLGPSPLDMGCPGYSSPQTHHLLLGVLPWWKPINFYMFQHTSPQDQPNEA